MRPHCPQVRIQTHQPTRHLSPDPAFLVRLTPGHSSPVSPPGPLSSGSSVHMPCSLPQPLVPAVSSSWNILESSLTVRLYSSFQDISNDSVLRINQLSTVLKSGSSASIVRDPPSSFYILLCLEGLHLIHKPRGSWRAVTCPNYVCILIRHTGQAW